MFCPQLLKLEIEMGSFKYKGTTPSEKRALPIKATLSEIFDFIEIELKSLPVGHKKYTVHFNSEISINTQIRLVNIYKEAGWKNVKIDTSPNFPLTYKYITLSMLD